MALADVALESVLKLTHNQRLFHPPFAAKRRLKLIRSGTDFSFSFSLQRLFHPPFAAKRRLKLIRSGTDFSFSFNTKCEDQVRTFRTAPLPLLTRDRITEPAESAGRLDITSAERPL